MCDMYSPTACILNKKMLKKKEEKKLDEKTNGMS